MKKLLITLISAIFALGGISQAGNYTAEQQDAYDYAHSKNITTVSSIEKANMNGSLTRIAMAKMISNFAINVLGLQPDTSINCSFSDVPSSLDFQYNYGVTQACQLGLMGIGNNGEKSANFNPYVTVTRAQFATAFSRALSSSNGDNVLDGQPYYKWHLQYLKSKGIVKDINSPNPNSLEKRGNVMIMMMRYKNTNNKSSNLEGMTTCSDSKGIVNLDRDTGERIYYYKDNSGENTCSFKENLYTCKDKKGNVTYPKYEEGANLFSCNNDEIIVSVGGGTWGITYLDTVRKLGIGTPIDNNLEEQDYVSYYENGQIREKGQYRYGEKSGKWIEYFENGDIKSEGSYKNGELDGYWIRYCERGDTQCISLDGNYKNGEKIWGVEEYGDFNSISYWSNGQIKEAEFRDDNGVLNGDYVSFYENGQLKEQGQYKNNKKTGEWVEYFDNGEVKSEKIYENDMDLASYFKLEQVNTSEKNLYRIKITNQSSLKIRIMGIRLGDYVEDNYAKVFFEDNTIDSILKNNYDKADVRFQYPVDISPKDYTTISIEMNEDGESLRFERIFFKMEDDNYGKEYSVSKALDL